MVQVSNTLGFLKLFKQVRSVDELQSDKADTSPIEFLLSMRVLVVRMLQITWPFEIDFGVLHLSKCIIRTGNIL